MNNSVKYSEDNRYSNVLAYDRTAVRVNGEVYLNANVVCDGRGRWYVAAQVSPSAVAIVLGLIPAQAPPPHAQHAFLRAIHDRSASSHPELRRYMGQISTGKGKGRAAIIVQLTAWEENGRLKADPYLPYVWCLLSGERLNTQRSGQRGAHRVSWRASPVAI